MGGFVLTLALGVVLSVAVVGPNHVEAVALASRAAAKCIPASQCCMICDTGQACGNSCISRKKTCHKGRGCSCNASEICPVE